MNDEFVKSGLISEIHLSDIQSDVFIFVVKYGKFHVDDLAVQVKISSKQLLDICHELKLLGGFIELGEKTFEALHPRFASVNMYRNVCEKEGIPFGRNKIVDNIGITLESVYYDARTK